MSNGNIRFKGGEEEVTRCNAFLRDMTWKWWSQPHCLLWGGRLLASFQALGGGLVREGLLDEIEQQPIISHRSSQSDPVCRTSTSRATAGTFQHRGSGCDRAEASSWTYPQPNPTNTLSLLLPAKKASHEKSTIPQPRWLL